MSHAKRLTRVERSGRSEVKVSVRSAGALQQDCQDLGFATLRARSARAFKYAARVPGFGFYEGLCGFGCSESECEAFAA